MTAANRVFLHKRLWILPWIKSISNELDIIILVIASQLSDQCDTISNRLWRHQQNENRASETRRRYAKIVVLSSFMDSLCSVRNEIMYVLSWRTFSVHTQVLLFCYFPRCFASREINTKITWALTQFVTRVHTLFCINFRQSLILWFFQQTRMFILNTALLSEMLPITTGL